MTEKSGNNASRTEKGFDIVVDALSDVPEVYVRHMNEHLLTDKGKSNMKNNAYGSGVLPRTWGSNRSVATRPNNHKQGGPVQSRGKGKSKRY